MAKYGSRRKHRCNGWLYTMFGTTGAHVSGKFLISDWVNQVHVWGESEFIWMVCKLCLCFNVFAWWESISAWPSGRMWQLAEKRHYAPTVEASDCTLYTIRLVGSQCTKTQSRETALCGGSGREWMYTVQTVQTPCSGNQFSSAPSGSEWTLYTFQWEGVCIVHCTWTRRRQVIVYKRHDPVKVYNKHLLCTHSTLHTTV